MGLSLSVKEKKDEAPMLYNGEKVGNGSSPKCDVAVDPIDGTTLTSLGRGNAMYWQSAKKALCLTWTLRLHGEDCCRAISERTC